MIDWIHEAIDQGGGIIINPAAFTFTSIAILDALKMFRGPIIELHITNIHRREAYYHHSYVSKVATGGHRRAGHRWLSHRHDGDAGSAELGWSMRR